MSAEKRMVYARTLCFVTDGSDVLMLRGAPNKRLYANLWNGVGGHLEAGEDVLACVRREVQEETGLTLSRADLRAVVNVDEVGRTGVVLLVFLGKTMTRQVVASREGELAWVPADRLLDLELVPDLRDMLPAFLDPGNRGVWFGHFRYDAAGALAAIHGSWAPVAP